MTPPNTVPIDWQEFQLLLEAPIPVLCFNSLRQHWITVNATNWKYNKEGFEQSEFRIAAHDYRHYFGEVVDLKEYNIGRDTVSYCGNTFQLVEHSGSFHLWNISNGGVKPVISYTKSDCQQWLCDHFTALFKKDRPQDNIRFIWS